MITSRYIDALTRNINEIGRAILERRAMIGLEEVNTAHGMDFIRLAYAALFNDMIAHAIKVLEKNKDVPSFWYIKRKKGNEVSDFIDSKQIDLARIESVADRLWHIRNKTHFHIDNASLGNPAQIWRDAKIQGDEFGQVLDDVYLILDHLHHLEHGKHFALPDYNGADAAQIAEYAESLRSQSSI